ncbi:MAG: chromosome segregation protein SMC [bacterium]
MYLKQLELLGFKSFANKLTVHFSEGITAIVGPNGCGKTNILDAIRWVLGEQRISLLRGSKMEEIIFNGTRDVKPLGMSEVTLTLVNNRGILPIEYNEVQVTRRLFRSGESEYLLNKVPCRRRDISELFFDTGVGAHSYSVIQQEMIESVISDRAEERRFLFEEAAGITKYKQRKKAALRKLEATEHDFLRLNDIFAEVKTQVNSLKRQQRKADRYQKVVQDIRDWELYLSADRLKSIEAERQKLLSQNTSLEDQRLIRETSLDTTSAELEADRKKQVDLEHELTRVGNIVYQASEKAHGYETEISVLTEKRSHARSLIERNRQEIDSLQARHELLGRQIAETDDEQQQIRQESQSLTDRLRDAEEKQTRADRQLLEARTAKERENAKLIDLEGKLSSGRTESESLRGQEEELKLLETNIGKRIRQQTEQQEQLRRQIAALRETMAGIDAHKTETEQAHRQLGQRLEQLLEEGEELANEISHLGASLEACRARKKLLTDMIVHYEGYESGVVEAMATRERFGDGLVGTVADKFVPVEGMETVVEAALGEMAGFVICRDRSVGETVIEHLKKEKSGKIGILVPDTGTLNPVVKRPHLDRPEFIGWLDSFISTDSDLRPLMEAVVARTAVFKAGADPREILRLLPFGFKAVSSDGVVYGKNVLTGGSDDRFPLFRRQEKVNEQQQMIDRLQQQMDDTRQKKNRLTAEIAAHRAESSDLSQKLETLTDEIDSTRTGLNEIEFELRSVDTELDRLLKEQETGGDRLDKIHSRQQELGLDCNQLAGRKENLNRSVSEIGGQLSEYESAAAEAVEQVSRLQVAAVETRSKIEQAESKRTHLLELQQEIDKTTADKSLEIGQAEQEIETSTHTISEREDQLKIAFRERSEVTTRQSELRSLQAEVLEQVTVKEKQLKEIRQKREALGDEMHRLEMDLHTLASESKAVCDRMRDEFEVEIMTLEPVKPNEELDDENTRRHLIQQKETLKKFGAVNLLALQEYQTAAERKQFLQEQLADLTNAKNDLQTTITRINQTARNLFNETFGQVRENFKKLFLELFDGGEADIFLKDPDDPLESDIEIIARPGRKKLISINQMSGGERALTAISLLFALYLVKPSPFCILDEIDAPLDDTNCRRFLKLIASFSDNTQFVNITHNKITMAAADNLYGVTMEQPGISKLVAVKFADIDEDKVTGAVRIEAAIDRAEEESDTAVGSAIDNSDELPPAVAERLQSAPAPDLAPDEQG